MNTDLHVSTLSSAAPPSAHERAEAVELLAAGFADGPNFTDLFPAPAARGRALPHLFGGLLRDASRHGRIDLARRTGELVAVAVWFDPWAYPPSAGRQARMLPTLARLVRAAPRSMRTLMTFNRRLAALHPPQPYAYLTAIAVKPGSQGQGAGSRLLTTGLHRADEARTACYLEAQRPATVAWYERHGFEVESRVRFVPDGALNWTMLRPARGS